MADVYVKNYSIRIKIRLY